MTIWTMFPFGRMARDIGRPGQGLIHNPSRFLEKFAGIPVHDLSRKIKKRKEEKEEGTYYTSPKPGLKYGK